MSNLCRVWDDACDNFVYQHLEPGVSPIAVLKAGAGSCRDLAKSRLYVAAPAGWIDDFVAAAPEQGALEENIWVNPIDSD